MGDLAADVRDSIRDIPDFPTPGILFKDITPVLQDADLLSRVAEWMSVEYSRPTKLVGIESRGFIFGAAMVAHTKAGLVLARKKGKLPHVTIGVEYGLEYGTATLEMHKDSIKRGDRVVIVDDLLATGGTAEAAVKLVRQLGGEVLGCVFLTELSFLEGRRKLKDVSVTSLVIY